MIDQIEPVFELGEMQRGGEGWKVLGRVFGAINVNQRIVLSPDDRIDADYSLYVVDIIIYGRHIEKVDSGLSAWLILHADKEVDLSNSKYLYSYTNEG